MIEISVEKSIQIDPFRRKNVTFFVEIRLPLNGKIKKMRGCVVIKVYDTASL